MDFEDLASPDPQVGLAAAAALSRLAARMELIQVRHARAAGWSWADIAEQLGVSKQAAHRKYGKEA